MKLLTLGNTKTAKGEKKGYHTYILHLAPANLSGYNVCPKASVGCKTACLNTAGRGKFNTTQIARIRKTKMFFENRNDFMSLLVKDIKSAIKRSEKLGFIPVFRLNGTSDIRWETVSFTLDHKNNGQNFVLMFPDIMTMFPNVQFYDYTALLNRTDLPSNYHLTFSRKEDNDKDCEATKLNIAVVFDTKKGADLPETFMGRKVVDGDVDDLRFNDPQNVVVGLRGKGDAKKGNHNGFVVLTRKGE